VTLESDVKDDPLTSYGRSQAKKLGEQWSNVRIDHLYASYLKRAVNTAREISEQNVGKPEIEERSELREHDTGDSTYLFKEGLIRTLRVSGTASKRRYKYDESTESYEEVSKRAREFVEEEVLGKFGVCQLDVPKQVDLQNPGTLPEGLPHVVIVSHNVFITELYEGLLYWNREHFETDIHWNNACWQVIAIFLKDKATLMGKFDRSRHILCYDMVTGDLELRDMCSPAGTNYLWRGNCGSA
jgi:broad specificity phosphatase PhoE